MNGGFPRTRQTLYFRESPLLLALQGPEWSDFSVITCLTCPRPSVKPTECTKRELTPQGLEHLSA